MAAMAHRDEHERNDAAYWREKDRIAREYPAGRFVAFADEKVIADAPDFDSLRTQLLEMGKDPANVLIVEAGVDYPKEVVIFCAGRLHGRHRAE
mgnify:CR=1 FL=1